MKELLGRIRENALAPEDSEQWNQIKGYLNTKDDALAQEFFASFRIDDANDAHWKQRSLLIEELNGYLAGSDKEVADQLWRLVVEKALPEQASNPEITREDVLRFLNTDEDELFPAPCSIESAESYFAREQEDEYFHKIFRNDLNPVILHAEGGVGKTVLAKRLCHRMPSHSVAVLYDCFNNGEYRNLTQRRDEHRVGLVQIANELASHKLCHPLIPSTYARPVDYLKAFNYRLRQSIKVLKGSDPDARLVLLIDAADNAEMAAEEYQERASFAKDLIRQQLPDGVVLVLLSRTHRIEKLGPPSGYVDLKLRPFSEDETANLLRKRFPDATSHDVLEFHRLSSQNPRVQAIALDRNLNLPETLFMLGPNPTTVEDAIKNIFEQSIKQLLDSAPKAEAKQIHTLCEALAALRPFIPIKVLSLASGLSASAIRTFILDLGRPLSLTGDAVQFFDEPSETWFRETYKPTKTRLIEFIRALQPLALKYSYVASALPQLMLEAGQYGELVDLVLKDEELPDENPVDKRNASLQRLQFALKAALRNERYDDAAKLALKAGGETAGNDRQKSLIQDNTDLISHLLPAYQLQEIVSQKTFSTDWHGGHHAYEACLLSGCADTLAESRSYLRLTQKWVHNWSQLSKKERENAAIDDSDIAEMAMCQLYLNGAESFVKELENWKPRVVAYHVGSIVFQRMVDLGQHDQIDDVVVHSLGNICILLAAIDEQSAVLKYPHLDAVQAALRGLKRYARQIQKHQLGPSYEEPTLSVVNSVVQAAIARNAAQYSEIADVLDIYIPSPEKYYFSRHSDEPRFTLLRANCLRAALRGESIELSNLAKPEMKRQMEKESHYHDRDIQEFLEDVGTVLPWHTLWTRAFLGQLRSNELDQAIEECVSEAQKASHIYHRDDRIISKEISRIWIEILLIVDPTTARMERFVTWKGSLKQKLFTPALTRLARLCAHSDAYSNYAYDFAKEAFEIINEDRMDAEQKIETCIDISRAIYALSSDEAEDYVDKAVEVAGQIGQENMDRWSALLELAFVASDPEQPQPELCYRLSRAAEVVYDFVARDKHFDWDGTIEGITKLCPASSLAILSRWKDRKFCWAGREFPYAIKNLVDLDKVLSSTALALIGYRYGWPNVERIQSAIASVKDKKKQKALFNHAVRYIQIGGTTSQEWESIVNIATQNGWEDWGFEGRIALSTSNEEREDKRNSGSLGDCEPEPDPPKDWDYIFEELQQTSPESIQEAHRRMWEGKPPYHTGPFAEEFFRRVTPGQEKDALEAIFDVSDFDLYHIRSLYESIPQSWLSRNHIRSALERITKRVCKEFSYEISKSRYYQALPYEVIVRYSGVTEMQIYHWVVEAIAENPLILDSGRLFSLVGLIVPELTKQQAAAALDYGLGLLEEEMTEIDGDGKWSSSLQPPDDVGASLAGYVWASLASPDTAERWQAAHVVCLLCAFESQEILGPLLSFALGHDPSPFHDSGLPIYELSARLWLLIALHRATKLGYATSVLYLEGFIRRACHPTECHIMLRGIAAKTLLDLDNVKAIKLSKNEKARLQVINSSKFDVVVSSTYRRNLKVVTPGPTSEEEKYYFGCDISPYWFESLGKIFSFGSSEIEHRALRIIRNDFGVFEQGGWKGDPRHRQGLYEDRETYHSHGSYPQVEDLSFYHAYHSMMMVAGELIDTVQRHQDKEYSDELEEWIARHSLTRTDDLWLADRRDPDPIEIPRWKSEEASDTWCFSVTKDDLLDAFQFADQGICVWGSWNNTDSDREERISVSSALVDAEHAHSLMRALQTASNPHDYRIPPNENDLEIDSGHFQLKGWIFETSREHGIDERDPWAGDIDYPPLRPAKWFATSHDLQSNYECRIWHSPSLGERPIMYSYVWGWKSEKNDYITPKTGSRLVANVEALKLWLSSINMDLILEVQIKRKFRRGSYRHRQEDTPEYLLPYTLVILFRSNGEIETI
ncbi:MAG: NACHT domain-containing protein [Gammaproteobacteria bacterium]|nr:NACHT domain-containing protein [Gammaproteobacteria bacterium]